MSNCGGRFGKVSGWVLTLVVISANVFGLVGPLSRGRTAEAVTRTTTVYPTDSIDSTDSTDSTEPIDPTDPTHSTTRTFTSTQSEELLPPPGITHTFSNTTNISMPVNVAAGTPYPSSINVAGIPNELAKITVTLRGMNHTFVSDIDVLLVGPQGQTAIIFSDIGGGTDLVNATVTLDDEATRFLPALEAIENGGTYKPTNGSGATPDPFPSPAPVPPNTNAMLSVFNGTNPNGEWKLFMVDDVPSLDGGSMAMGWTLNITSAFSGQNSGSISIPESGVASPYPSEINLTDLNDPVSKVRVNLQNFTHASPDDVDIMLASPSGRVVTLMSDVGGANSVSDLNLTFDDAALVTMPDTGPIVSGTYRPTDFEPGDNFPAPAPAGAPGGRTLSSLNGSVANGAWRLFVVDDAGNNVGGISGGWNLLVVTRAGTIVTQGAGVANPYPSTIDVLGMPGNITRVTVSIENFSHLTPDDVDILLVNPQGRKMALMSDAGGSNEAGGVNLTFADSAPQAVPDSGQITTGEYRPTDYEAGDEFPAPAPGGPHTGNTLGAFYGGLPNGTWSLYVVSDGASGFGSIAGAWSLTIESSTSACLVSISPAIQAFPVGGGSGSFSIGQPTGCAWTATTTDPFISITSASSGGGNGSLSFAVAPITTLP